MNDTKIQKHIDKTGEWWIYPWWEEPGHQDGTKYSPEETLLAINRVKELFDVKWFLQNQIDNKDEEKFWNAKPHPFMINLNARGTLFLIPLISFGLDLDVLFKNKRLAGNLFRRLKLTEQFHGARFELLILAHLIRQGFNITRDPKSCTGNKNCDF
jgi:hypothetical protein